MNDSLVSCAPATCVYIADFFRHIIAQMQLLLFYELRPPLALCVSLGMFSRMHFVPVSVVNVCMSAIIYNYCISACTCM